MNALVGYTGFVGSNIYAAGEFDAAYNSKNIEEAYGTNPELLIYAGLKAEKYLANLFPEKDMELIVQAEDNIAKINPKRLVLISTIDVFKIPRGVDETFEIEAKGLNAYGYNRYQLELWVRERYSDALIIRLPGLFGKNIKKNFIYDYINRTPFMLSKEKMEELNKKEKELNRYYILQENGFYKARDLSDLEKQMLKEKFQKIGFSALSFTDSRSIYQFYNLGRLWQDIQTALKAGIRLWHPATEPVSVGELYYYLSGEDFTNELCGVPVHYDYRSIYAELFGGEDGYIESTSDVKREIKQFIGTMGGTR